MIKFGSEVQMEFYEHGISPICRWFMNVLVIKDRYDPSSPLMILSIHVVKIGQSCKEIRYGCNDSGAGGSLAMVVPCSRNQSA